MKKTRRVNTAVCANIINKLPTNFEQYRAVTLLFIEGVIGESSTHKGPLDEESGIIQKVLGQLNRLDCLTVDSQPYEQGIIEGTFYRSRPFLRFYYPRRKVNQLLELFMHGNPNILTAIYAPGNKVIMYNDMLYTNLADAGGYFPLHQDFIDGEWVESFNTTFNPNSFGELFDQLSLTNDVLLRNSKENLVLLNVIGMDFNNDIFTRLAHAAHALFFA